MRIAVAFDGCIAEKGPGGEDAPLRLASGARQALKTMRDAEHVLILYSTRANLALRIDPRLDPLVRAGIAPIDADSWERDRVAATTRYRQMIAFVEKELPGVFAVLDDGLQGKPDADLFIDPRALRYGPGPSGLLWTEIGWMFGHPIPRKAR